MRGINVTIIFVIAVFIIGALAIYAYEHFRYSPFALQVDQEVIKEYLRDRHVELLDIALRGEINRRTVQINKRMSTYDFALRVAPMLSILNDGVTRIEIPLKTTDQTLPLRFKYINDKVIVSMSSCEIPVGSIILTINGYPIENIVEKYKKLFPTLDEFQQKYAFVDKLLSYYPRIIEAQTIQIKYQLPQSNAQRTSYIKSIPFKDFQRIMHVKPMETYTISDYTIVKINSFNISNKNDLKDVIEMFHKIAQSSKKVIFDLRYASDGDIALPTMIISKLITSPAMLYPKLISRHKFQQIEKQQIPVEPDPERLESEVYFIVDKTCFYTPHKTLLTFLGTHDIGKVITFDTLDFSKLSFYTDEFWKILPNTRTYITMPLSKVVADSHFKDGQLIDIEEQQFTENELTNRDYYIEWLKKIVLMLE